MSIQNEITRITNKRDQSFTKVASKGVTVPSGSTIDDLPDLIDSIRTYDVYTITKNLSDVTTNNDDTEVIANGSFYMNLVPGPGKVIDSITVTMGGVDITDQVFTPGMGYKAISTNGTYSASSDSFSGYNQVVVDVPPSGITPTGTKNISINENGTTIEDVTDYAAAQIIVQVPQAGEILEKDVNFYDYDGTRVYSYTTEEFQVLSGLPSNPSHEGLTAQGWNYTKEQALTTLQDIGRCNIGQNYVTDDGKTRLYITVSDVTPTLYIRATTGSSASVDWGDGTQEALSSNTYKEHTYQTLGEYVISITGITTLDVGTSYGNYTRIISRAKFWSDNSGSPENKLAWITVNKFEVGANITNITGAFGKLSKCKTISIPANITTINKAFQSCFQLSNVVLPNGVKTINDSTFASCFSLRHVSIPTTVTSIGTSAFNLCVNLTEVVLPNSITSIANSAFQYCYNLTKINIPESITTINNSLFQNCYNLTSIDIPSGVTTIGTSAFYNCYNLINVNIPNTVTSIGANAFYNCSCLTSINIPSGITTINASTFYSCTALIDVKIPEGVTTIGNNAFYYCASLTNVTIPSSVTTIGSNVFNRCRSVTEYHLLPQTPPTLSSTNTFTGIQSGCHIYVPYSEDHSILNAYKTATNWSTYANYMVEEDPE